MVSSKSFEKIKKNSKLQKSPKSFPKSSKLAFNMLCGYFSEKKLPGVPWRVGPSEILKKNQKNFKIPKVPKVVSKSVQTCFDYALGQFFRIFFALCSMQGFSDFLDLRIWVQFSGPKNQSSLFRNITQQTFFLHSRHSQCTQSHFRFSGPKILSPDSRTEKFEISFPTQKSTDILFALTPQSVYAIPFQIFWT